YDVMSITTSSSVTPSRTTIPGGWQCNVNYRFAPVQTLEEANEKLLATLEEAGASREHCEIVSAVYAGTIVENDTLRSVVDTLGLPLEAKQAWTDVAQFGELGVSAFNFGPGLTEQCHKDNEYMLEQDMLDHYNQLRSVLLGKE
ncbi:MAG: hypothetical protein KDD62_03745, partial [Bdellovibrionales bacterium]|nr:hypothetical protein [Bdellovibrionales bacterium]